MAQSQCFICHTHTVTAPFKFDVRIMRKCRVLGFRLWHRVTFCSHRCFQQWACGKGPL